MTKGDYVEPKTFYKASADNWDQWHWAMKEEVKALQDDKTWNIVRKPTDKDVIPGNLYKELENFLLRQGFIRSKHNHCLFARAETEDHTFILVWVDDIVVASRSMTVISDVKKVLEETFHMEDSGRIHWFLGLSIRREEGKVTVDQERYIETVLERFQMDQ